MNDILQANIFFVISSVGIIFLTILVIIILVYILKIVRDIHFISNKVREGSESLSEDLGEVRSQLKEKGVLSGFIIAVLAGITGFTQMRKKKKEKE